jgi:hypothetical protein
VLEGLKGEATNKHGEVNWDGLVTYVKENVNTSAKLWFPDRAKYVAARSSATIESVALADTTRVEEPDCHSGISYRTAERHHEFTGHGTEANTEGRLPDGLASRRI